MDTILYARMKKSMDIRCGTLYPLTHSSPPLQTN